MVSAISELFVYYVRLLHINFLPEKIYVLYLICLFLFQLSKNIQEGELTDNVHGE